MPVTKEGFGRLCKALNLHCSEMLAFEGLIYCRGKQMENGPAEDFDFDRLVGFLHMKSKIVPPADNPRIALSTKPRRNDYYPTLSGNAGSSRLPALRATNPRMHHTNRSLIRSQQSYDSQDQRITQAFRTGRAGGRRIYTRGSQESNEYSPER